VEAETVQQKQQCMPGGRPKEEGKPRQNHVTRYITSLQHPKGCGAAIYS
jgi:hypothetical protein